MSFVIKGGKSCLLGQDWLSVIKLDWHNIALVQRLIEGGLKQLLGKFQQVLEGNIGTIKGFQAKLLLKEGAKPQFYRARPGPFAIKEAVAAEFDHLEREGILEKVSASNWATPIVVVPKRDGSLRLCGIID